MKLFLRVLIEIIAFVLYWWAAAALGLRQLKRSTCHTRAAINDPWHNYEGDCNGPDPRTEELVVTPCSHKWTPTSSLQRRHQGVYAICARCEAQR